MAFSWNMGRAVGLGPSGQMTSGMGQNDQPIRQFNRPPQLGARGPRQPQPRFNVGMQPRPPQMGLGPSPQMSQPAPQMGVGPQPSGWNPDIDGSANDPRAQMNRMPQVNMGGGMGIGAREPSLGPDVPAMPEMPRPQVQPPRMGFRGRGRPMMSPEEGDSGGLLRSHHRLNPGIGPSFPMY